MKQRFISRDSFPVIGLELKTSLNEGRNFREIPRFWEQTISQAGIERVPHRTNVDQVLGICLDFMDDGRFSYIIGCEVNQTGELPDGMVCRTIQPAHYAVFTPRGQMPGAIQDAFRTIDQEWFPGSGYRRSEGAEFELYDERFHRGDHAEIDIYIPVVKV